MPGRIILAVFLVGALFGPALGADGRSADEVRRREDVAAQKAAHRAIRERAHDAEIWLGEQLERTQKSTDRLERAGPKR